MSGRIFKHSLALLLLAIVARVVAEEIPFSDDWRFIREDASSDAASVKFDDGRWEKVTLPHSPRIEALPAGKGAPQWQGICWYRKTFDVPASATGKTIILRFEGALNAAEIWVNGSSAGKFMGGYLPYVVDISKLARPSKENVVVVRLDNRDNPLTGPKPLAVLDFNLYGGLYRGARLLIKDRLHITDSILANKVAGGGIFVTFPEVSTKAASIQVKTHIENAANNERRFVVRQSLLDVPVVEGRPPGDQARTVASTDSPPISLPSGSAQEIVQDLKVANPRLWSPQSPALYRLRTEVVIDGKVMDAEDTRVGIRRIEASTNGFAINGQKMFLRGCNRHQEYPFIGNALSDAAQYRDALKIKEAGFDYIRLSHYPQSPAFLDACDELGIVVMDSILGWQYFGKEPEFTVNKYRECRELIRRDRNHPSVILWEVSLNESGMPKSFVQRAHAIAHEEYPGDQCYTAGWTRGYDVFIQARQHGGCRQVSDVPCLVSEYGDWEYYAQNAGLDQARWKDLAPAERSSRQLRGDGEVRLLQQALNFQEAHNDNLRTRAFGDGIWVMFDYNRGYAPDLESSGVMDVFRLPKFGYHFFRSQRDRGDMVAGRPVGPMVFIANNWTAESPLDVRVFSNCDEVALLVNGKLQERRRPDANRLSEKLRHPPFTFQVPAFQAGQLTAIGYVGGREVTRDERRTPGSPQNLALRFDGGDRAFGTCGKDQIFCHAELQDKAGTLVPTGAVPVVFGVQPILTVAAAGTSSRASRKDETSRMTHGLDDDCRVIGGAPAKSEAGIATCLLETGKSGCSCVVFALGLMEDGGKVKILSSAASPNGAAVPEYTIHYTTDGSDPTIDSPVYENALSAKSRIRATIFVNRRIVAKAELLPKGYGA